MNLISIASLEPLWDCLSQLLLHFVWQGAAIAALAMLVARSFPANSAKRRHDIYLIAMLAMLFSPLATWIFIGPVATYALPGISATPIPAAVQVQPVSKATSPDVGSPSKSGSEPRQAVTVPERIQTASIAADADSRDPSTTAWRSRFALARPWIVGAYLLGLYTMLVRLVVLAGLSRRLVRRSSPVCDPAILELVESASRRMGLAVAPSVVFCRHVLVPAVTGFLRPVVLLPLSAASELSPDQIEAILMHELAHIRRHDHLIIVLQHIIESLLFFHPAVWYVSRRLSLERECCCDDLAVGQVSPEGYIESLVRVAEIALRSREDIDPGAASLASVRRPSDLRIRVGRLLGTNQTGSMRISPFSACCAGGVVLAAILITLGCGSSPSSSDANRTTPIAATPTAPKAGNTPPVPTPADGPASGPRAVARPKPDITPQMWEAYAKAIASGNVKEVARMIDSGMPVDEPNQWGQHPLLIGASCRHPEVIQLLIDRGAKIDGHGDLIPLAFAAQVGDPRIVALLLKNHANAAIVDASDRTVLASAVINGESGKAVKLQIVRMLIDAGAKLTPRGRFPDICGAAATSPELAEFFFDHGEDVNAIDFDHRTPLYLAAASQNADSIRWLRRHGALTDNGTFGKIPLLAAITLDGYTEQMTVDAVNGLLEKVDNGLPVPNVNILYGPVPPAEQTLITNDRGHALWLKNYTAIYMASALRTPAVVEALLAHGADPNITDEKNRTALDIARMFGRADNAAVLETHGARSNMPISAPKPAVAAAPGPKPAAAAESPEAKKARLSRDLMMAISSNNAKVAIDSIEQGADVNAADQSGWTPLILATETCGGETEVIKALVRHNANVKLRRAGQSAVTVASYQGRKDLVDLYLAAGATLTTTGQPDICHAAGSGNVELVQFFMSNGQDVNAIDGSGDSPMAYAARRGQAAMVKFLRAHGAKVDSVNDFGQTPLILASTGDSAETIEALLAKEPGGTPANVNIVVPTQMRLNVLVNEQLVVSGYTPLHAACGQGSLGVVTALMNHGADPNAVDANGMTPLKIADRYGRDPILEVLKKPAAN